MDQVAQGATWSETFGPITDVGGNIVADDEANITLTIYDANDVDRSSGATVAYVGAGLYRASKAIPSDGARGWWPVIATWDDGDNPARTIPGGFTVLTAAQYDPASALSGYRVTVVNPIAQSGLLTIKRGDWYNADDGRALEWIDEDDQWPDLTDALITFAAKPNTLRKSTDFILVTGSVVVPTGEGKTIRVEFTTPDTETMTPGKWTYDVQAVTSPDGHNVTLVSGPMVLEEDFVP